MNDTLWMLQGRYEYLPIVPADVVARDFFDLDRRTFLRKVDGGDIKLPLIQMERSQKSQKGVHIRDLAKYIDCMHAEARRQMELTHS